MGTNFYARKKISQKQRDKFCDYIENNEVLKAANFLAELKEATKRIHIGKRSCGWKFLWDCHDFKYFEPSKKSLMEFLSSCEIANEYDEELTLEEFLKELDGFLDKGYDIETYYNDERNKTIYRHLESKGKIDEYKQKFDIDVNPYGEFYIDDLRFTVTEDFS